MPCNEKIDLDFFFFFFNMLHSWRFFNKILEINRNM